MNKSHLQRVLDLVQRTGDKAVYVEGEQAFIIMPLEEYELMLDVEHDLSVMARGMGDWDETFEEDGQCCPHDEPIRSPEPGHEPAVSQSQSAPASIWDAMAPAGEGEETWDLDRMSPEERLELERQYKAYAAQQVQEAMKEVVEPAPEPVLAPKPVQPAPEEPIMPPDAPFELDLPELEANTGKESQDQGENEPEKQTQTVPEGQQESQPDDEDFGEEQFYLEPIE